MRTRPAWLLSAALLAACAVSARAGKFDQEEEPQSLVPGVKFSGLLDARFYETSREVSWLRGGTNSLRYGGRDTNGDGRGDRTVAGASLPQASLVVDAEVKPNAKLHIQANFSTDASSGTNKIGIVEAYGAVEKAFDRDSLSLRAGGLIPKISWEHPDPAWSTRYTLTPSAIGSWIGEEVRVFGAEALWEHRVAEGAFARLTGGGFSGGDQIGRLLWFRGWSLDDYQGDLAQRYNIQSRNYSPLEELDGRLGYYGRGDLQLFNRAVQFGGGYWTNNANDKLGQPGAANLDTQAFRTRLFHYGGKIEWGRFTLIGQFLKTTISTIALPARDWTAAYGLASVELGRARLSFRYDRFGVLNWDSGHAYTGFAAWNFSPHQQVGVEYVYANQRPGQAVKPTAEVDRLGQLNYRFRF